MASRYTNEQLQMIASDALMAQAVNDVRYTMCIQHLSQIMRMTVQACHSKIQGYANGVFDD